MVAIVNACMDWRYYIVDPSNDSVKSIYAEIAKCRQKNEIETMIEYLQLKNPDMEIQVMCKNINDEFWEKLDWDIFNPTRYENPEE